VGIPLVLQDPLPFNPLLAQEKNERYSNDYNNRADNKCVGQAPNKGLSEDKAAQYTGRALRAVAGL
jgi:hypothetical protein